MSAEENLPPNAEDATPQRGARGPRVKNRPTRVPLGQRGRLTYSPEMLEEWKARGLRPRLINDAPGRVADALKAGYQFVTSDGKIGDEKVADPTKMGAYLSVHTGSGVTGYLMVQPEEWYQEDQKVKQDRVDDSERAMKPQEGTPLKGGELGIVYGKGLTNE
jgi:hypothetical protein